MHGELSQNKYLNKMHLSQHQSLKLTISNVLLKKPQPQTITLNELMCFLELIYKYICLFFSLYIKHLLFKLQGTRQITHVPEVFSPQLIVIYAKINFIDYLNAEDATHHNPLSIS